MAIKTGGGAALLLVFLTTGCSVDAEPVTPPAAYALCTDGSGPDGVIAAADRLVLDGEADAAAELYRTRLAESADDGCAARGLAYIAATPARPGATSGWDAFFEAWLRPAYQIGLPFLVVLAVLALTARALTATLVGPGRRAWDVRKETGFTIRRVAYVAGIVAMVAVAAWAAIVNPLLSLETAPRVIAWSIAALLAVAGVLVVATASGLALRVRIEGRGDNGDKLAGHVRARLQQMGSEQPAGARVAADTDVTALPDDALSALPQGDLAKAVFRALQALAPTAPWKVVLTTVNDRTLAVEIFRNGRLVDAGVITPPAGAGVADDMRARGAAAFVLVTLAERHRALRTGLNGATRWRSVALQMMAGHPEARDQRTLLAQAVEFDPGNVGARVALLHVDGRRPGDAAAAETYARGLETVLGLGRVTPSRGDAALYLRAQFNAAAGWLISHGYNGSQDALERARVRAAQAAWLAQEGKYPELAGLAADLDPAITYLRLAAGDKRVREPEAGGHLSMTALYTRACYRVMRGGSHLEAALDDLAIAVKTHGFAEWARQDPALHKFRDPSTAPALRQRFRTLVGAETPAGFLDLAPLREHAADLKRLGINGPDDLLLEDPADLAFAAGVTSARVRRWRALAELAVVQDGTDAQRIPIGVVVVLLDSGVAGVEALRDALAPGRRAAFVAALAEAALRHDVEVTADRLDRLDLPPARRSRWSRLCGVVASR